MQDGRATSIRPSAAVELALTDGSLYEIEFRIVRPDGDVRVLQSRGEVELSPDGRPLRLIGVCQDITERKKAEENLRAAQERTTAILGGIADTFYSLDRKWRFTFVNPAAEQAPFGRPAAELLGKVVWDLFPGLVGTPIQQHYLDAATKLGMEHYEARSPLNLRWYEVFMQGWAGGVDVYMRDITERKRAEAELRRANERLELALRASRAGTWDWDVASGALAWSPEMFGLFGLDPGKHTATFEAWDGALHPEDLELAHRRIEQALRDRTFLDSDYRIMTPEGQVRWIHAFGEASYDKAGQPVRMGGLCIDISARKRAEEALIEAHDRLEARVKERTAELEQVVLVLEEESAVRKQVETALRDRSEKLRALAMELAQTEERERKRLAQVLHDHLQQLLVAAKFSAASLRNRAASPDIKTEAERVLDLLGQSIEASRSLTAELSPPVLHDAGLAAGLMWLARWMQEKHGLTVEVTAQAPAAPLADDLRLMSFQAVRELLFNIVKHSGVKVAQVTMAEDADQNLRIVVSDQGKGCDAAALGMGNTPGSFGLFNIRERLAFLDGRLEIESAPGEGTRVILSAPIPKPVPSQPKKSESPSAVAPISTASAPGAVRVLVADDHTVVRKGLVEILRKEPGIDVVGEAQDGQQAVEQARLLKPDVVLMDVTMPLMSGIEATRILSSEMPEVRVIGLSMHAQDDMAAQMRGAGAVRYLVKDGPAEDLIKAIHDAAGVPSEIKA